MEDLGVDHGQHRTMIGLLKLGSAVPKDGALGNVVIVGRLSSPQNAIRPSRNSTFLGRVVVVGKEIVLVGRGERDRSLLEALEDVAGLVFDLEKFECYRLTTFLLCIRIHEHHNYSLDE